MNWHQWLFWAIGLGFTITAALRYLWIKFGPSKIDTRLSDWAKRKRIQ